MVSLIFRPTAFFIQLGPPSSISYNLFDLFSEIVWLLSDDPANGLDVVALYLAFASSVKNAVKICDDPSKSSLISNVNPSSLASIIFWAASLDRLNLFITDFKIKSFASCSLFPYTLCTSSKALS